MKITDKGFRPLLRTERVKIMQGIRGFGTEKHILDPEVTLFCVICATNIQLVANVKTICIFYLSNGIVPTKDSPTLFDVGYLCNRPECENLFKLQIAEALDTGPV
jgi:hypothetical protein